MQHEMRAVEQSRKDAIAAGVGFGRKPGRKTNHCADSGTNAIPSKWSALHQTTSHSGFPPTPITTSSARYASPCRRRLPTTRTISPAVIMPPSPRSPRSFRPTPPRPFSPRCSSPPRNSARICLRLAQLPGTPPALKCSAQALSMMRQAQSTLRLLLKMQEVRGKREANSATCNSAAWTEHCAVALMGEALAPAATPAAPAQCEPAPAKAGDTGIAEPAEPAAPRRHGSRTRARADCGTRARA
jgi:hypothetical protein